MIDPFRLGQLVSNIKTEFDGEERNLDDIIGDEKVLAVFLKAVDHLYETSFGKELENLSEKLKARLRAFSFANEELPVACEVNETCYKIQCIQSKMSEEQEALAAENELKAPSVEPKAAVAEGVHIRWVLDPEKARSVLDFLKTASSEIEFSSFATRTYPQYLYDETVCLELFKKFPHAFDQLVMEPLKTEVKEKAFAETGLSSEIIKKIATFPFTKARNFLIKSLFLNRLDLTTLDKKNCLLMIAFSALSSSKELISKFKAFIEFHTQALKDGKKVLDFIKFMDSLASTDKVPEAEKGLCFTNCLVTDSIDPLKKKAEKEEIKKRQFQETSKKIKLMTTSIGVLAKADLAGISSGGSHEISKKLFEPFLAKLGLDARHAEAITDHFLNSRHPMGLFEYSSSMEEPIVIDSYRTFIENVSTDTFKTKRHEANSHKEFLTPKELAGWEKGAVKRLPSHMVLVDSEDWQDLFFCGTEVQGSCQALNGDAEQNKALMGYCLDGKCRVLCLKEAEDKPIKARAIFRIFLDEADKPSLYMDDPYPYEALEEFKEFAKERAEEIGLPLYFHGRDVKLFSKGCAGPYEYSDANFGIQDKGIYEFSASRA